MYAPGYSRAESCSEISRRSDPSPFQGNAQPAPSQAQNFPPVQQGQNDSPVPPAPLPPVGVVGASHNQLGAVLAALQQQTAALQRSQELQATENAQITTSDSRNREQPASNGDEEEEIDMESTH